ncbi:10617_t:CDS:2, partial [Cetraspora pellucida]
HAYTIINDIETAKNRCLHKLNDQNIIVEERVIIKNQINDEPIIFSSNATILLNEDVKPIFEFILR